MESNIIYFYSVFFLILGSAAGIIFSPKMYLALLSLFVFICSSSALYLGFGANYAAFLQLILCGIVLSGYLFLLLKKIGTMDLKLKLNSAGKIITSAITVAVLGVLVVLFFVEEFENSLYEVFNFVQEKSFDAINFVANIFPLHLVIIFVFVSAIVLRIFLSRLNTNNEEQN